MNISVCITTLNEEESIGRLLESLLVQSRRPNEIVIVDGGSTDNTNQIIRHYQKKDRRIKLLVEKCSRAKGRNLGVEVAKGDVVALTDAGCTANKFWLERIVQPFIINKSGKPAVDVVAGFYKMSGSSDFQKASSVFLGVLPNSFDVRFLPSTRSIAFTKDIWEKVGGFSESSKGAAEDTVFNFKLIKNGARIARVKNAIVEWGTPRTIQEFGFKIYNYAKGDAKSKIWMFPGKGLTSHNIKAISVIIRYIIGLFLIGFSIRFNTLPLPVIAVLIYLAWSYRKVFVEFGDRKTALWGPVLQIVSDFAVMRGFVSGIIA